MNTSDQPANGERSIPPNTVPGNSFRAINWYPQQVSWVADPFSSDSVAYNYPLSFRACGRLDLRALQRSLEEISRRHDALRSIFEVRHGVLIQSVLPPQPFNLATVDLTAQNVEAREPEARRLAVQENGRPFRLDWELPLRATVVMLGSDDHIVLITTHHIVFDDWSADVFLNELSLLYSAYASGEGSPLPPVALTYRQFAFQILGLNFERELEFWRKRLADRTGFHHLVSDRSKASLRRFTGAHEGFQFPAEISTAIRRLCQRESVSPFMSLVGAFQCLLARHSGEYDIGIGCAVANRNSTEVESLIGPICNRILLRTDLSGAPTYREVLNRVRNVALDAYVHQAIPFGDVLDAMPGLARQLPSPFQVLMVFQSGEKRLPDLVGLRVTQFPVESRTTGFDLDVRLLQDGAEDLRVDIRYNVSLFTCEKVRQILEGYRRTIELMIRAPDHGIWDLPLQGAVEKEPLVVLESPETRASASRDEIDRQLQKLWEEVLGVQSVGMHDNFFELGGDSLGAARLFAKIQQKFHLTLPLSTVLEAPTIEALAGVLRDHRSQSRRTSLVALQPQGSRPPIFCIHARTGDVFPFRGFPKHLGPDQPLYGLQSQALSGGSPHFSVNEMAAHYLRELQSVRPHGPYYLFGFSFGGLVAFEIAQQLRSEREEVAFLGMLYTPPPGSLEDYPLPRFSSLRQRVSNKLGELRSLSAREKFQRLSLNALYLSRLALRSARVDGWRLIAKRFGNKTAARLGRHVMDINYVHVAAAKNYRPTGVYPGRITFFVPEAYLGSYGYAVEAETGWSPFAAGGLDLVHIPNREGIPVETAIIEVVSDRLKSSIEIGLSQLPVPAARIRNTTSH